MRCTRLAPGLGLLALVLTAPVVSGQESFTAIVARVSGAQTADVKRVSIRIDRYTPDADAEALGRVLSEGGQAQLLTAVQRRDLGSVVVGDEPAWTIRAARATVTAAGRRILVGRERSTTSTGGAGSAAAYPFQFVELDVDAQGDGIGRLIEEAQLSIDATGAISIASYHGFPQMLVEVKRIAPR